MKPQRYEISETRRRLPWRSEGRGVRTGFSGLWGLLFGLPFVAFGTVIVLVSLKVIPINPSKVHVPYWILTTIGAVFALAGLMVWARGWSQYRAKARARRSMRGPSKDPALADYPWNPRGFEAERWKRSAKAAGASIFLTLFLAGFNYWAFFDRGPWPVKTIVVLFDLLAVGAWCRAFLFLGRALKFGGSGLVFSTFPYRLGKPIVLHWQPASGIREATKGSFVLRCVEEYFETTGTGEDRNQRLVQEEIWSGTWFLDRPENLARGARIDFEFNPPEQLPETQLSAERPFFWEFEVKLELPGLDFEEVYLVPVY
jgi:hypothetical protein